jgi:PleD family two-component response regulator
VGTEVAERLGQRLARAVLEMTKDAYAVTVSIGVAVRSAPVDVDAWLHAADQAMFEAKRMSPGSVRVAEVTHRDHGVGNPGTAAG